MAVPSMDRIRAMPKFELHAHLSGSITQKKLIELLKERGSGESFTPFDCRVDVSNALVKCFDYFEKVAKVVTDLAALKATTLHVFDTFAAENCLYLEMRTSPKTFGTGKESTTKVQYLETIYECIKEFNGYAQERFGFVMDVKILLSVNRGTVKTKEDALTQIDDILDMRKKFPELVVGVDVCGNPAKMTAVPFIIPALLERKAAFEKLPITYHLGEVSCDDECRLVLEKMSELNIRRLGHCCFVPDDVREKILAGGIHKDGGKMGLEFCPTSNLVTKEMNSLKEHHWPEWSKSENVLLSINTDDTGLFSCDLTSEVFDLASAFNISWEQLVNVQRQALESSFHPQKSILLEKFEAALKKVPEDDAPGLEASAAKRQRVQCVDEAALEAALKKGRAFDFCFQGSKEQFDKFWRQSWKEFGCADKCTRLTDAIARPDTTADSENRKRDKAALEERLKLQERGNPDTVFYRDSGEVLATGYVQILYGDHGDYVELMEKQINWSLFSQHKLKGPDRHYHEHKTADGSIQLYDQFKTVADEPNPPPGPKSKHNNRPEGYAPYRPGVFYMPTEAVARIS